MSTDNLVASEAKALAATSLTQFTANIQGPIRNS